MDCEHWAQAIHELIQLAVGKEVDEESFLRPSQVPDREAAGVVLLDYLVPVLDLGTRRVHSDAHQPAWQEALSCGIDMGVRLGLGTVLKDLDADDRSESGCGRKRSEIAVDQPFGAVRKPFHELLNRYTGDIETYEVHPVLLDERYVVPAIAAADVQADITNGP